MRGRPDSCDHPDKFLPEVTEASSAFEDRLIAEQDSLEQTSNALFEGGHEHLAQKYLTDYSSVAAAAALKLGNALLGSFEARTRLLYGLRAPKPT